MVALFVPERFSEEKVAIMRALGAEVARARSDGARARGNEDKIGQLNPLKLPGQPHELAAMGLFLASDDASYVNGQAIPVDGGWTAR